MSSFKWEWEEKIVALKSENAALRAEIETLKQSCLQFGIELGWAENNEKLYRSEIERLTNRREFEVIEKVTGKDISFDGTKFRWKEAAE